MAGHETSAATAGPIGFLGVGHIAEYMVRLDARRDHRGRPEGEEVWRKLNRQPSGD